MKFPYFQNYFGANLTEDEYQDIEHPFVEVYTHVTLKTLQLGTTFGTLLFGPLIAVARKGKRGTKVLTSKMSRAGMAGVVVGILAGPAMTYKKLEDQTYDAVYDRAYRIRKNHTQVKSDQGYVLGGVVGLAASAFTKTSPVFGGLVGMSTGLVGVGIYNNFIASKPSIKQ